MVTQNVSPVNKTQSASVTLASPVRRNALFLGISGLLLAGMFSVASASNHTAHIAKPADDPIAAAQADAASQIVDSGDKGTMDALIQLRDNDPKNGIYSYLIAAQHARRNEWRSALAALRMGNEAPQLTLAQSASSRGNYPALPVLRQLVSDCAAEATRDNSSETSDALLEESAILAGRMAHDAMPCDLTTLQTAGVLWRTTEQARIASWEKQERFVDVDTARARLATRSKWWQQVNDKINHVDNNDTDIRVASAESLRAKLPL